MDAAPSGSAVCKYTVPPFSRVPTRLRGKVDANSACAICGRRVAEPVAHMAVVIEGGAAWGDASSDERDPGYMGGFPVGPDCHKRFAVR